MCFFYDMWIPFPESEHNFVESLYKYLNFVLHIIHSGQKKKKKKKNNNNNIFVFLVFLSNISDTLRVILAEI